MPPKVSKHKQRRRVRLVDGAEMSSIHAGEGEPRPPCERTIKRERLIEDERPTRERLS